MLISLFCLMSFFYATIPHYLVVLSAIWGLGEEIKCHSHHIKKKEIMTYLLLILISTTGLRDYLLGYPLSIPYFLEGSHYAHPTLVEWQVMTYFLDGSINK